MTSKDWITEFDLVSAKFKWFFLEYGFAKEWWKIISYRNSATEENYDATVFHMKSIMNDVWFKLPDNVFNIIVMPKGWKEFLSLIEE